LAVAEWRAEATPSRGYVFTKLFTTGVPSPVSGGKATAHTIHGATFTAPQTGQFLIIFAYDVRGTSQVLDFGLFTEGVGYQVVSLILRVSVYPMDDPNLISESEIEIFSGDIYFIYGRREFSGTYYIAVPYAMQSGRIYRLIARLEANIALATAFAAQTLSLEAEGELRSIIALPTIGTSPITGYEGGYLSGSQAVNMLSAVLPISRETQMVKLERGFYAVTALG